MKANNLHSDVNAKVMVESDPNPDTDVKWHSHYCDPKADMSLVSNDDVHFKVNSYYLCKASGLFANLRDSATPSSISAPLSIDAKSDVLEIYLDLVSSARPDIKIKLEHCLSLLPLCDFLDSPTTSALIAGRLEDLIKTDSEETFVTACRLQDVQLAKSAVKNMWSVATTLSKIRSTEDNGGFLIALLEAITKHLPHERSYDDQLAAASKGETNEDDNNSDSDSISSVSHQRLPGRKIVKKIDFNDTIREFYKKYPREESWWEKVVNDFESYW